MCVSKYFFLNAKLQGHRSSIHCSRTPWPRQFLCFNLTLFFFCHCILTTSSWSSCSPTTLSLVDSVILMNCWSVQQVSNFSVASNDGQSRWLTYISVNVSNIFFARVTLVSQTLCNKSNQTESGNVFRNHNL